MFGAIEHVRIHRTAVEELREGIVIRQRSTRTHFFYVEREVFEQSLDVEGLAGREPVIADGFGRERPEISRVVVGRDVVELLQKEWSVWL